MRKVKMWQGGRRKVREANDFGAPEQQRRRILLAGGTPRAVEMIGDVVVRWSDRSEEEMKQQEADNVSLDVVCGQDFHSACLYWLGLRKRMFGKAMPGAVDLLSVTGPGVPDQSDKKSLPQGEAKNTGLRAAR